MSEADLARRIELERKDAERGALQRFLEVLKAEGTNAAYRSAYNRIIKKLENILK